MVFPIIIQVFIVAITISGLTAINVTNTDFGILIGSTTQSAWTSKMIYQFLGVRYAESPSGDNRFTEPQIAIPWPGVHDVQKFGRPCPNLKDLRKMTPSKLEEDLEDCLHLSIYTRNISAKNPVMVYIHGGSFVEGSSMNHPPNYLLEKNIVVVVPQYRLGPMGFLCTLTADIPGNAGVLDVILALTWIKAYISNFGGDPNKITVVGQSAGASIVSAMLWSPNVPNDLFSQAIIQSGSYLGPSTFDLDPVASAIGLAEVSECYNIDTIDEINQCFLEMDVLSLLETYNRYSNPHHNGRRLKLALNSLLPFQPIELLKGNIRMKNVTILTGVTKHDGAFMLAKFYDFLLGSVGLYNTTYNSFHLLDTIIDFVGIEDKTCTLSGYLSANLLTSNIIIDGNLTNMLPSLMDISNVITIKGPVLKIAQLQAQYLPKSTYLYSFEYRGEFSYLPYLNNSKYPYYDGIQHCDDLIYLFPYPNYAANLNPNDREMAKVMTDFWTSFVIAGIPTTKSIIQWPPMSNLFGPYLHINSENKIGKNFLKEFSVITRESV